MDCQRTCDSNNNRNENHGSGQSDWSAFDFSAVHVHITMCALTSLLFCSWWLAMGEAGGAGRPFELLLFADGRHSDIGRLTGVIVGVRTPMECMLSPSWIGAVSCCVVLLRSGEIMPATAAIQAPSLDIRPGPTIRPTSSTPEA